MKSTWLGGHGGTDRLSTVTYFPQDPPNDDYLSGDIYFDDSDSFQTLGATFDTSVDLLGYLARTHGSLRAAVEAAGMSPLPPYVEELLSKIEAEDGPFQDAVGARRRSAQSVLWQIWSDSDERERLILRDRIAAVEPATLEEIAQAVDLTRERVRQLQVKLLKRLEPELTSGPLANLMAGIRAHAYPVNTLDAVIDVFPDLADTQEGWDAPLWRILDAFDDDFRVDDGWVCFPDLPTATERTAKLLAGLVNAEGVVLMDTVLEESSLNDRGVLTEWLTTCGYLVLNDHVLTRTSTQPDRAASVLSITGRPMTVSELFEVVGDVTSERSFRGALARGENLVRVGTDRWALASWGLEEYTSIADIIGKRIDAAVEGGSDGVSLEGLVEDLSASFGASPSSVRTYAATGDFACAGGIVRRRTTPMENTAVAAESNGLYWREGRWCYLMTVSKDHLRGSGVNVPNGLTSSMGLSWNQPVFLPSELGEHRVHWGNNVGLSSIGSVKRFLDALGCGLGDRVWIDLHDGERFSVTHALESSEIAGAPLSGLAWLADHVGAAATESDEENYASVSTALGLAPDAPRRKILARFRHRKDQEAVSVLENLWM